jgi:hypothetical protein
LPSSHISQVEKLPHCEQSEPSAQGSLPVVLVLVTVTEVWVVETVVDVVPLPPPPVLPPPLPHAATANTERTKLPAANAQVFMNYLQ